MVQPEITAGELLLRPFRPADAADVRRLAGDPAVSDTALDIPHPFEEGMAAAWIGGHAAGFAAGTQAVFAVVDAATGALVGAAGLMAEPAHGRAELGYWIGRASWGRGLATLAARAVVRFGFTELGLRRIHASHLARNPASGRVLAKAGLVREGVLREHVLHRGRVEDLVLWGAVRAEWVMGDAPASMGEAPHPVR